MTIFDGDRQLRDNVTWWSRVLGLGGYRIETRYGEDASPRGAARSYSADDYPHAIIEVRGKEHADPDWDWKHWPEEESAVHELLHVVTVDLNRLMHDTVIPALPKPLRKPMRQLYVHEEERLIERVTRALVAVAYADRAEPSPEIGGLVTDAVMDTTEEQEAA